MVGISNLNFLSKAHPVPNNTTMGRQTSLNRTIKVDNWDERESMMFNAKQPLQEPTHSE
jgi:hypothetical protein